MPIRHIPLSVCQPIFLAGIVFDGGRGDDKLALQRGNSKNIQLTYN